MERKNKINQEQNVEKTEVSKNLQEQEKLNGNLIGDEAKNETATLSDVSNNESNHKKVMEHKKELIEEYEK